MNNRTNDYSAGLMSEAPWFLEFKKIALLRNNNTSTDEIRRMCVEQNLFGMPKEYRALRTYCYLANRLNTLDDELLQIFCESDIATQKLINYIAIIKKDRLLFEFTYEVYREKHLVGFDELTLNDINVFFTEKCSQNEAMSAWKDTTLKRLRSGYFQFLTDANLVSKVGRTYQITPAILDPRLENYLKAHDEEIIIKALTGVA